MKKSTIHNPNDKGVLSKSALQTFELGSEFYSLYLSLSLFPSLSHLPSQPSFPSTPPSKAQGRHYPSQRNPHLFLIFAGAHVIKGSPFIKSMENFEAEYKVKPLQNNAE